MSFPAAASRGIDDSGKSLDLMAEGVSTQFVSDNAAVSISADGVVQGVSEGAATIRATVVIGGETYASNSIQVIVGHGFSVQEPSITDVNGNPLTSFSPYGLVKVSAMAINSTDDQQNVTLIVALYNRQGLIKSAMQTAIIPSYDNATLTTNLVIPQNVAGCYLKVFVWDGKDAMHPLTSRMIYPN